MLKALVHQEMTALLVLLERLTKAMAATWQQIPPNLQTLAEGSWCLVLNLLQEGLSKVSVHAVSPEMQQDNWQMSSSWCYVRSSA